MKGMERRERERERKRKRERGRERERERERGEKEKRQERMVIITEFLHCLEISCMLGYTNCTYIIGYIASMIASINFVKYGVGHYIICK